MKLNNLFRAFSGADATIDALVIIDTRDVVYYVDCVFWTSLFAQLAPDTACGADIFDDNAFFF